MTGLAFFDTNILIYADDRSSPKKQGRAVELIAEHHRRSSSVVSLQVMQEYFAAVTRKLGVEPEIAQRKVEILARGKVIRFDERDVIAAIELHRLSRIPFWDAMIAHAARIAGAKVLYSEDFQHGSVIAGIPVVNPFLESCHRRSLVRRNDSGDTRGAGQRPTPRRLRRSRNVPLHFGSLVAQPSGCVGTSSR